MNTVPNQIFAQLGHKALVMLGVNSALANGNTLHLKFRASLVYNGMDITLNAMDTYDITFRKMRGIKTLKETTVENVYWDELHGAIKEHCKVYLSL